MEEEKPEQEQKEVPSISFNDNQIVIDTFEVPLNFNGEEVMIKMKKLTAGDKRDLVKTNSNIKLVGTQTNGTVDGIGYAIGLLTRVIVDAPFTINEQVISSLPEEVLDYLVAEYTESSSSKKKV